MADWYAKVEGIYRQSREHRQMELIEAARYVAREEAKNPYLSTEEQTELANYGFFGTRTPLIDAFILAQKKRIYDYAFSTMRKTAQEWIDWFETIESHVPEKIKAYAIAQGNFAGIDNHAPMFANTWKAYGEKCKREAEGNS